MASKIEIYFLSYAVKKYIILNAGHFLGQDYFIFSFSCSPFSSVIADSHNVNSLCNRGYFNIFPGSGYKAL